jgi:hypothetical protein
MSQLRPADRPPSQTPNKDSVASERAFEALPDGFAPLDAKIAWPAEIGNQLFLTVEGRDKRRFSIVIDPYAFELALNLFLCLDNRDPIATQALLAHLNEVIGKP